MSEDSSFPHSVLRSRWLLVIALTALVAFGGPQLPTPTQYGLVAAMILSNAILALLRKRGVELTPALGVITVIDVLIVALVMSWVDPSPATYVAVFAALILASALGRVGLIMVMMLLICGAYAGYLYTEVGADFWRDVTLILRVPFIFAVGLHFASIASYLKKEKAERDMLVARAKQHAERADHLAKEQDRLRALSQIGRLALTAPDARPVRVLMDMATRSRNALGASSCTLILFPRNRQQERWNGHSKDRKIEVRSMKLDPESLSGLLLDGKLTEIHPGNDKQLMGRIKVFYPDSNPFGSLLVAPIYSDEELRGGLFLLDQDHQRKFSEGERDFMWTVALLTGAFMSAREKLEHEVQLRTLITNAPVIMFALNAEGVVTLLEGRGVAALRGSRKDRLGKLLFDVVGNRDEAREAFERALSGKVAAGALELDGLVFETQYSPLRGVDGKISGVMGVTTAILDSPAAAASPAPELDAGIDDAVSQPSVDAGEGPAATAPRRSARAEQPEPARGEPTPGQSESAPTSQKPETAHVEPTAKQTPTRPEQPPAQRRRARQPIAPTARPDLKPTIPLKDED